MNPRDFCYWLQGFFEISKSNQLSDTQVEEIKNHLQLVFKKETPEVKPFEPPTKTWSIEPSPLPSGSHVLNENILLNYHIQGSC